MLFVAFVVGHPGDQLFNFLGLDSADSFQFPVLFEYGSDLCTSYGAFDRPEFALNLLAQPALRGSVA